MAKSTSIAISAKDNFSGTISSMRKANQAFRKDIELTEKELVELNNKKVSLKIETDKVQINLADAKKALKNAEEGTEAYEKALMRLADVRFDQTHIENELRGVSSAAKQAESHLNSLKDAGSKMENQAGGLSMSSSGGEQSGILSTLAASGAAALLGNVLGSMSSTFVGSAYGKETGTYFDSILSMGGTGAGIGMAIGTAIAPGIGTALGAAIGALGGGIIGAFDADRQIFEEKDDYFKTYYQDQFNALISAQQNSLVSGSVSAAGEERDAQRLMTLFGVPSTNYNEQMRWFSGSSSMSSVYDYYSELQDQQEAGIASAKAFREELDLLSSSPSFSYESLLDITSGMLSLGKSADDVRERLGYLEEAGAALNLSGSDMSNLVSLLDTATELGKMDTRVVRTLIKQYGIDVKEALAGEFMNDITGALLSEEDVLSTLENLDVDDVVDAIYRYMGEKFEGAAAIAAESFIGIKTQFDYFRGEIDEAMGEGYNEERKSGMRDEIAYMSGESGEMLKGAYAQIGQWQASLENLREELERDALSAVMSGSIPNSLKGTDSETRLNALALEYSELSKSGTEEAGAKMGALLAEAQAIAANEYNASEGFQLQLKTQLELAGNLRNNAMLKSEYYDAGYEMGVEFSKGLASGADIKTSISGSFNGVPLDSFDFYGKTHASDDPDSRPTLAYGIDRVPYDNYPAVLHEGERVLTARETRNMDAASSASTISISGNDFVIREEADIYKIAQELVRQIGQADMLM